MPTVKWQVALEGVQSLSQMNLDLGNPYPEEVEVIVTLASHGLDQRIAKRSVGSMLVAAGTTATFAVDLAALPIQGVTYSSLAIVELDFVRSDGTAVHVTSEPFYYHFDSSYSESYVYEFDTMDQELNDGQLTDDGYDLAGRVWSGGSWVDIDALRELEGAQPDWMGSTFGTDNSAWADPQLPPMPQPAEGVARICFNWRTKFIDSGYGEDVANVPFDQTVPASYGWAGIYRVRDKPCVALSPSDACLELAWNGYLDEAGCVLLEDAAVDDYVAWTAGLFEAPIAGANPYQGRVEAFDPITDEYGGVVGQRLYFRIPSIGSPQNQLFVLVPFATVSNPSAALSRFLATADLALGADMHAPFPDVFVFAHRRATGGQQGVSADDARARDFRVFTGDWIRHDNGRPGGMQYKSILAHEIGHTLHYSGSQAFDITSLYHDDLPTETLCKCHVTSANAAHCLQSREQIGVAQVEGFGQFVAAKVWNDPTESDCTLVYYKEYKWSETTKSDPPFGFDCRNPLKWRNSHCFDGARGTEQDWMLFFWNINTQGSATTTIDDLWKIFAVGCGGGCGAEQGLSWSALRSAAESHFLGQNPAKQAELDHFDTWGDLAGVNEMPP